MRCAWARARGPWVSRSSSDVLPRRAGLAAEARRFLGAAAVDGFFNGFSRLARFHPQAKPERHAVEHLRDIRYRGGTQREHLLDVYRPAPPTKSGGSAPAYRRYHGPPWPMVFYVHGGGFRILSKDTHWIMGLGFARRGF